MERLRRMICQHPLNRLWFCKYVFWWLTTGFTNKDTPSPSSSQYSDSDACWGSLLWCAYCSGWRQGSKTYWSIFLGCRGKWNTWSRRQKRTRPGSQLTWRKWEGFSNIEGKYHKTHIKQHNFQKVSNTSCLVFPRRKKSAKLFLDSQLIQCSLLPQ